MAKKKKTRPADRHRNRVMGFRPPAELRAAVEAAAAGERRTVSVMLQILVEEALAARKDRK